MHAKTLLLILACAATTPAQQPPQQPPIVFSVATVRPSHADGWRASFIPTGYLARGARLRIIIQDAFGIYELSRYSGLPSWVDTDQFDIEAKVDEADLERFHHLTGEQSRAMLQALLADRFKLVVHHQGREEPAYLLTIAKGGSKLQASTPEELLQPQNHITKSNGHGLLAGQNFSADSLAGLLTFYVARHVVNTTGLAGSYDFSLHWTPDNTPETSPDAGGPSLFTAVQEQLGLKLEPGKATLDAIVIDHIEHPTEN